ncbi:hypothetical protein BGZ65_009376 [Modicella reniformis]|uniref:Uncharacterized protein n=1 Tax=Modicella reniformis TaxID=1440133 RepID=A0A9P6SPC1_9FUNG|nr:hypothetical protein BGZ65_009376 [Modicella reniformis]
MGHARSHELSYHHKGIQVHDMQSQDSQNLVLQVSYPTDLQSKQMSLHHHDDHGQHNHQTSALHSSDNQLNSSAMDHLYDSSASHHYPPFDVVPPPTQDLFRTLMEELQTQAAIQRDQFLASSAKHDSSGETTDYSFNGHHARPLPRFMMEPLDFLSPNYESCLEPGPDSYTGTGNAQTEASFQQSFASMNDAQTSSSSAAVSSISPPSSSHSSTAVSEAQRTTSAITSESSIASNPRKRPMSDDSHMFDGSNESATPQTVLSHEHLSPPTQDLFRMLMEELETQAAIQRDQVLASTTRSDATGTGVNTVEFSFNNTGNNPHHHHHHHHHNHHHSHSHNHNHNHNHNHSRLPRFVMDPFDFLSEDYGSMQVDNSTTPSSEAKQDVFMGQIGSSDSHHTTAATSSDSIATRQSTTPPSFPTHEEHLPPPTQDLFRTLMEELETQAAFQPRSPSNHPSPTGRTVRQNSPISRPTGKTTKAGKYKAILPHRPKSLNLAPNNNAGTGSVRSSNPLKKRKLGDKIETVFCGSSSSLSSMSSMSSLSSVSTSATSPSEQDTGDYDGHESPISPTGMSALSITSTTDQDTGTNAAITVSSPEGSVEGAGSTAKRPWTPKEEQLLLKLFVKRMPIKEIAQTLDRTVHSVRSRRQILTDPGFVKGKGHGVSRRCKADPTTTTKLPTYAQMAFLSLAWLPDLEGTLNDVASMVEKLFSRHLNRIPRTGHKNLQIWRAQISDALAHEKGQPRPRFESFGLKRGRQWVYRLTEFGKGIVEAMGGVDAICQDLLRCNEMEMAASLSAVDVDGSDVSQLGRDADGMSGGKPGADAGIGQGQGYGYSYRPPEARQKTGKRSRASRRARKKQAEAMANSVANGTPAEGAASAIANAMEAMAAGLAKMMALEDEKTAAAATAATAAGSMGGVQT